MCEILPVTTEYDPPLDLLERQPFIDQLKDITALLAKNKRNACFAINGCWGAGKSFVLQGYEKQVGVIYTENEAKNQYLVFRYDCWKYDYYEEPLIAIVAAMLDAIDEKDRLIPEENRKKIKGILKATGTVLLKSAIDGIKEKTGIDVEKAYSTIKDGIAKAEEEIAEDRSYDVFFSFKKALAKLREMISELAERQTIVFIVDELDRCLPEYTIKVLERLHHVFDDIPNVQVILSMDKEQLGHTIRQIYGENTSIERYLEKFIDFEVKLVRGEISNEMRELYPEYYASFSENVTSPEDVDAFCTTILKDIDIRTCKTILEKSWLCHKLLNADEQKQDGVFLCIEVFLSLLRHYGIKTVVAKKEFSLERLFASNTLFEKTDESLTGLNVLAQKYKKTSTGRLYFNAADGEQYVRCQDVYGIVLGCYRIILGFVNDTWMYLDRNLSDKNIKEYIHEYWKYIKIIN